MEHPECPALFFKKTIDLSTLIEYNTIVLNIKKWRGANNESL
jgi:hypothetical protein